MERAVQPCRGEKSFAPTAHIFIAMPMDLVQATMKNENAYFHTIMTFPRMKGADSEPG